VVPPPGQGLPTASIIKFGEPFEIDMWGAVIVDVAAIGLATPNRATETRSVGPFCAPVVRLVGTAPSSKAGIQAAHPAFLM
jgi:hypothetical protein